MKQEKLFHDILDVYYGESQRTLDDLAQEHAVSLEFCEDEWNKIHLVSQKFDFLSQPEPSQITINRIMAYAREHAQQSQKISFWQILFKPALGFSVIVLAVFSFLIWQNMPVNTDTQVAQIQPKQVQEAATQLSPVVSRLFQTPMDVSSFNSDNFSLARQKARSPYLNQYVSNVSVSYPQDNTFNIEEDLEKKMMAGSMDQQDLETLFFRARKMEKLGYVQEALNDYLFLAKNFPQFEYQQGLPLAIARCYERLGDKTNAIHVLEAFKQANGASEDLQIWIDILKSETF